MLNPGDLVKGHQDIKDKCASCHKPFWGIENDRCITCHKLSEIGKDSDSINSVNGNNKNILFHGKLMNTECTLCHTDHEGIKPVRPVSNFDHSLLSPETKSNCNDCHGIPSDKLHSQISNNCSNCHNTDSWKFSGKFDHNLIQGVNKNECLACHKKHEDSFHRSLTSENENCSKCHSTDKWKPSTFDHRLYFVLDKDHNAKCGICHTNNNFSQYTCYGCHEHSESNISGKHIEEGINNFSDCVSCHKSGDEHDIKRNNGSENNRDMKNEEKSIEKNNSDRKEKEKKYKNEDDDED